MASGSTDFSGFADSSMMRNEINGNIEYIEKELLELEVKYQEAVKSSTSFQTSSETVENYLQLLEKQQTTKMSKREKGRVNREIKQLIEDNKFLENDIASLEKPGIYQKKIEDKKQEIVNINNYVEYTLKTHLGILEENGFISREDDDYKLTDKGLMASQIQKFIQWL